MCWVCFSSFHECTSDRVAFGKVEPRNSSSIAFVATAAASQRLSWHCSMEATNVLVKTMSRPRMTHFRQAHRHSDAHKATHSHLLCLQVVVRRVPFDDFGQSLLDVVGQLPALTDLVIDHDGPVTEKRTAAIHLDDEDDPSLGDHGMPHCDQLTRLRSDSLTRLKSM